MIWVAVALAVVAAGLAVVLNTALVELAHLVMGFFTFLLTANSDALMRLVSFAVFLILMVLSLALLKYLRPRSAISAAGASI